MNNNVTIPKELSPKGKIGFIEFNKFLFALPFLAISILLENIFSLTGIFDKVYMFLVIIFTVVVFLPLEGFSNIFYKIYKSIIFIYKYLSKDTYFVKKYKTRVVDIGGKNKKEVFEITVDTRKDDCLSKLGYNDINYDTRTYINNDTNIVAFYEIKIKELPIYESLHKKKNSIDDFHHIILAYPNAKILKKNIKYDFKNEWNFWINKANEIPKYKEFINLKLDQLEQAKNHTNSKYFIEIMGKDIDEIESTYKKLANSTISTFNIDLISNADFKNHIGEIENLYKNVVNSDHIYNEVDKKCYRFLSFDNFEVNQNPYYLRQLLTYNYDSIIVYKPSFLQNEALEHALAEIESRTKYSAKNKTRIDAGMVRQQISSIQKRMNLGEIELLNFDLIIKIEADTLDELNQKTDDFESTLVKQIKFRKNVFQQNESLVAFYKSFNKNSIRNSFIVSSDTLSYSYPFNFINVYQKGGLLKNINKNSLLYLNLHINGASEPKDMLILGNKGSGKSTALKELALDEIVNHNSNVIMFDFRGETEIMVNNFEGKYVRIGEVDINPLRINYNPLRENQIADHVDNIATFLSYFYPDFKTNSQFKTTFKKILMRFYALYHITDKTVIADFYPTMRELLKYLNQYKIEKENNKILIDITSCINDFIVSYPKYSNKDSRLDTKSELTSFGFDLVCKDDNLLRASLYWIVKYTNFKTELNKPDKSFNKYNVEVYKNYIKEYNLVFDVGLSDDDIQLNTVEYLYKYIENRQRFLRIIVDEVHRVFSIPEASKFMVHLCRESRRYNSALAIADQSIEGAMINEEYKIAIGIIPFKLLLKSSISNIKILNEEFEIPTNVTNKLLKPNKGQGVFNYENGEFYDYYSPINKRIEYLFDGGN